MFNFLVFLAVLSVLVLIHEAGHFLMAKSLGIRVEEFAFGLPFTKPLFKIHRGGMQWSVYPLLLGGFVRLYGEEKEPEGMKKSEVKDSFWNRPARQRLAVISAGVVMNIALGIAGFTALYNALGVPGKTVDKVTVEQVIPGSPAEKAGIMVGDRIVAVENKEITSIEEYSRLMKSWADLKVRVTVERGEVTALVEGFFEANKTTQTYELVPRANPPANEGATGVAIDSYPYVEAEKCPIYSSRCLTRIMAMGFTNTKVWMIKVLAGLRDIGAGMFAGQVPKDVAGPIGVYQITGIVAGQGFWPVVELLSILSINLAVFNFLPIPALDGGRAFFILLETVMRKRIPGEIEHKVNSWGFALLLAMMAAASFQDVIRLGWFGK